MPYSLRITATTTFDVKYAVDESGVVIYTDDRETTLPWDKIIKDSIEWCNEKMDGEWRDEALVFGKLDHLRNELRLAASDIDTLLEQKFPNLTKKFGS